MRPDPAKSVVLAAVVVVAVTAAAAVAGAVVAAATVAAAVAAVAGKQIVRHRPACRLLSTLECRRAANPMGSQPVFVCNLSGLNDVIHRRGMVW